jgi:uncharacterized membrane protein YhaH (DUF805 family)
VTRLGFWLNMTIASVGVLAFVVLAGVFGYKWLAHDEPNEARHCGSGSRGGICFSGETTNIVLTLLFAGVAVVFVVLTVSSVRAHRRNVGAPSRARTYDLRIKSP